MRPFRFLGLAAAGIVDARQLTDTARRAESLGYSALVLPDHLVEQHAPIPIMAMVAAATERLRIGTFVLNVDLRHPAVLAQDLASIDMLASGRLEIGIGAGWSRPEYDAVGLPFHPVGTRVARLREAVAVLKGCFADGPFSFAGEYYTITGHEGLPKPVQRPHPPFLIGGGGQRLLTLAGQQADIVGLAPRMMPMAGNRTQPTADPRSLTATATDEKIHWVRSAAGDRWGQLEINAYSLGGAPLVVTNNAKAEAQDRVDQMYKRSGVELSVAEVLESPHFYIGSVDGLVQKIIEMRERHGVSAVMLGDVDAGASIVERLAGR
ncbi:MAG TPA: TIGR03621 family F420-dependent LLM class oxidoreductase [Micromonosporaceae bacterium]|nr:TIGR03621 family F420-dependent LLM class oxidoreductase [Micromonosporaceae bacterium]